MATIVNMGRGVTAPHGKVPMPADPSCQPCPDCGGLECLCRPRFFAGQLLTEQDLNRLDHYITEKHKLHNRHLWGSGVVCGLEVRCAPCDELVTVTDGYALSPCGEDIVVCKPDTVDICALIARCRTDADPDCRPYAGQDACGDVIEDWILAIRYAESPSRGITPLTGAGQGCGCSCGGSCAGKPAGSCGCGCPSCSPGAAQAIQPQAKLKMPRLNRGAPPSCEPTVTCESYRYDVFRAPEPQTRDPDGRSTGLAGLVGTLQGDLVQRIRCCLEQLQAVLPALPGNLTQPIPANKRQDWFKWCCQVRTALANYLVKTGGYDCEAVERLQAVICPDPNQPVDAFQLAIAEAAKAYGIIVFEAMIACFCSAALPPCLPPGDPRVPLALVKVRRRDCHIVSVCNWTPLRQHVLTFPTLVYWWGWIPIIQAVRAGMHGICCDLLGLLEQFGQVRGVAQDQPNLAVNHPLAGAPLDAPLEMRPFAGMNFDTSLFHAAAMVASAGGTPTVNDLVNTAFSRRRLAIDPDLTGDERQAQLAMLADAAPLKMLGGMLAGAGPMLGGFGAGLDAGVSGDLRNDLAALKETVERQATEIEALKARIDQR